MSENFFVCPNCGEEVRAGAKACPSCGSDENTGWSDNTYLDGISLPSDDDYEDLKAREFGTEKSSAQKKRIGIFDDINWKMVIGVMIIAAMLTSVIMRGC